MMSALDRAAVSYRIVLTKADKVHATEIERRKQQIQESLKTHAAAHPHVLITSSDKASGIQELRTALAAYAT
jgi:GTP-binding protein